VRRVLFVVNPTGIRRPEVLRRHCEEAAALHGWVPELVVTTAGDASAMLHDHVSRYLDGPGGDKLVFAVGGDGTVRACAHDLAGSGIPLAIVPRGTANLFARHLGLPSEIDRALHTGFGPVQRLVDMPFADGRPFVAMAGLGIDAAVVAATPAALKRHLGWLGYALAALPHLAGAPREVTLHLDGGAPLHRSAHSVVVGNVGALPGGFVLLPGARIDDGLIDVGVLCPSGLPGWAALARRAVVTSHGGRGGHTGALPGVEHFQASSVEIVVDGAAPACQLDGDVVSPEASMSVRVDHRALVVRAPEAPPPE
jgi:diacylglycerol kinase family enzyme